MLDTIHGDNCAWQEVIDYEDIHEDKPWASRFPRLKFNTPDSLWIEDAQKALTVMFDCVAPILKVTNEEFVIIPLFPRIDFNVLNSANCNIDYMLKSIPEEIEL